MYTIWLGHQMRVQIICWVKWIKRVLAEICPKHEFSLRIGEEVISWEWIICSVWSKAGINAWIHGFQGMLIPRAPSGYSEILEGISSSFPLGWNCPKYGLRTTTPVNLTLDLIDNWRLWHAVEFWNVGVEDEVVWWVGEGDCTHPATYIPHLPIYFISTSFPASSPCS